MVTKFVYLQVDLYLIKLIHQSFFDVPWGWICVLLTDKAFYNKERVMFYNYAYSKDVVRD